MAGAVEILKGFVTFLREGIIVVVLLMLFFSPATMREVLTAAGIQGGSILGFELDLRDSLQSTDEATKNMIELEKRLNALSTRLDQIGQSTTTPPQVKEQIAAIAAGVDQTRSETRATLTTLENSRAVQRSIIQKVNPRILRELDGPRR